MGQCETDQALKGRDEQVLLNKTIIFQPRPVLHNLLLCHLAHEHFGVGATWWNCELLEADEAGAVW